MAPVGWHFGSLWAFDKHRVGKHAYLYLEGLDMIPPREDGRRCLDVGELEGQGWVEDRWGRWRTPSKVPFSGWQKRPGAPATPSPDS